MRYHFRILSFVIVILLQASAAWAFDLGRHVEEFKLDNGMRWLVVKRGEAPVFSGVVMVRVGGADELKGKTGIAHMFEHMAFKGSAKLGTKDWDKESPILEELEALGEKLTDLERTPPANKKEMSGIKKKMGELRKQASRYQIRNEVWEILMRNGASQLNAYTSKDITTYHASMPANRLELWANVTAQMIFEPAFREFYTERAVVEEERRTSVENSPVGALSEELLKSSYSGGPYSWSTIGFEEDVAGLTIGDARRFHAKHYVPSNMVGVIVGDVSPSKVKRIMNRVFGSYPKRPTPENPEDKGIAKGDVHARMRFKAEPSIAIAYHKPTLPNKEEYVFDVISALLCDGRSSWLEKKLIYEGRLAKDVYCSVGYPGSRFDNLFLIWIEPLKGKSMQAILRAVDKELSKLKLNDVSASDLERVHKQVTSSVMFALDGNEKLAEALARFETIFGDWKILANYPGNIEKVSAKDVKSVANEYLVKSNMVVVERTR